MFELYKLLGTKKTSITAYHLQTDGLVEQFSHTLIKESPSFWERLGYTITIMYCLHTAVALKSLPRRAHSFFYMAITLVFLLR